MKRVLMAATLVWLTACNDSSPLGTVQALPGSTSDALTLGVVLNTRPVCDSTVWTETLAENGKEAQVTYECVLSATQTQAFFADQWDRYQRRLAGNVVSPDGTEPVPPGRTLTLVKATETLTWQVPPSGVPQRRAHTVELQVVGDGGDTQRLTQTLGLSDSDLADVATGEFSRRYQTVLLTALSEWVR